MNPRPLRAAVPTSAIVCFLIAFFLFSCTDAAAKFLVRAGMHPPFLSWMRFAVHIAVAAILLRLWVEPRRFGTRRLGPHALRGLLLLASGLFSFWSLQTLQLVEFISLIFLGPLVITGLARPLLGEQVEWQRWAAIGVGLGGVLVMTRPGFAELKIGHATALGAMFTHALFVIMTRGLGSSETRESLLVIPAIVASVAMLPVVPLTASLPETPLHWVLLFSLGIFAGVGHMLMIRAYQMAEASALAPYAYMQMVWTALFGYAIFGDLPDRWTVAGSLVIVSAGLYLVYRDQMARRAHPPLPPA